jgi:hypothetical protein
MEDQKEKKLHVGHMWENIIASLVTTEPPDHE